MQTASAFLSACLHACRSVPGRAWGASTTCTGHCAAALPDLLLSTACKAQRRALPSPQRAHLSRYSVLALCPQLLSAGRWNGARCAVKIVSYTVEPDSRQDMSREPLLRCSTGRMLTWSMLLMGVLFCRTAALLPHGFYTCMWFRAGSLCNISYACAVLCGAALVCCLLQAQCSQHSEAGSMVKLLPAASA